MTSSSQIAPPRFDLTHGPCSDTSRGDIVQPDASQGHFREDLASGHEVNGHGLDLKPSPLDMEWDRVLLISSQHHGGFGGQHGEFLGAKFLDAAIAPLRTGRSTIVGIPGLQECWLGPTALWH